MNKEIIRNIVEQYPEFKDKLFCRGFVLTNAEVDVDAYPFYGSWHYAKIGKYDLLVSSKQHHYILNKTKKYYVLIGHAYNPIDYETDENIILENLSCEEDFESCNISYLNQLTGLFTLICISGGNLEVYGDATCMQSVFFGTNNEDVFVSSHTNLIGDLADLKWDSYVSQLTHYKFFHMLGNALPGDLTQFKKIKRLTPNFCAVYKNGKWNTKRFYTPKTQNISNEKIADEVAKLLHKNMELIAKKWSKPAISCTGGCDSKTTLACTSGLYDEFKYFSYISNSSEKVDALAAKTIINTLGCNHKMYTIPQKNEELSLIDETRAIIDWNTGDITPNNNNDIRKRRYFEDTNDFDVEVKSWASEIGRAYYSKRFNGRKNFGKKITPRKCTAMYKFFLHDRKLVRQTDSVFADFITKYFEQDSNHPIDWQDQLFWEYRSPSWNGLVITGEHRYSFDITIPYNNRLILELLLSASVEDRINDTIYKMIRQRMNPVIDETGIAITNVKHTNNRAKAENLYYWIMTHLPF